ncbi:hypothetical protein [Photobacterium sp. J15]|uniref:hypothetical protein n=1 Tax=Photobacterium sp. J15 TaxID=265901 RepID=UPI0012EE67B3|nr:hypothetical protein [Photobacterium sp. J15]
MLEDALFNGHTLLEKGRVLVGDGTGRINIGEESFSCQDAINTEDQANYDLVCLALLQIDQHVDLFESEVKPSPLIPSQLFSDEGKLNALEERLEEVLEKGHLHEISRRPRYDMRYDELVQPVSRAKRLASSSHRHLAAHSECWQRRTLTGIQPKKIMGLISEDEYHIYENRVFARLLDKLDRFLDKRISEVIELQTNLNEALDLENSTELNYRISQKLFALWGETFTSESALSALELLESTRHKLEQQSKKIKQLINGSLYKCVPRNAQVPGQLKPTNILSHDQHYRYLLLLWNSLRKERHNGSQTPAIYFEGQEALQQAYIHYCGMIIYRSLCQLGYTVESAASSYKCLSKSGRQLTVKLENTRWIIEDAHYGNQLELVAISSWRSDQLKAFQEKNRLIIPCCLNHDESPSQVADWLTGDYTGPLVLTPMDFYVEERLTSLLQTWLMIKPLNEYGIVIDKIPTSILPTIKNTSSIEALSNHSARLLEPISDADMNRLGNELKKHQAKKSLEDFIQNKFSLDQLAICPVCQQKAQFYHRDQQTFKAVCVNNDCKLEWQIINTEQGRLFEMYPANTDGNSFKRLGRWYSRIRL